MKITFYAHASFRLEAGGQRRHRPVHARGLRLRADRQPADLVIMSRQPISFHSDPSHMRGQPTVVDARSTFRLDGITVRGVPIRALPPAKA